MLESVNFGNVLKELRSEAGLTQRQLAAQIGVSKSILSCYESQSRMPSSEILVKLATVFHVSTDYLLGLDKIARLEVTGLTEDDIKLISLMIDTLKSKNQMQGNAVFRQHGETSPLEDRWQMSSQAEKKHMDSNIYF